MGKKEKKKKLSKEQKIITALLLLAGIVCGIFIQIFINSEYLATMQKYQKNILSFVLLLTIYIIVILHIIIHEAGHLVFALLSGYKFHSFRVSNLMLIKENGKLRLKRFSIPGTGGQSLMIPPDMVDGKVPFKLYILGGLLMNIISIIISIIIAIVFSHNPLIFMFMNMFSTIGFTLAIINGIPMKTESVNNDAYILLELSRNQEAMRAFWTHSKITEQISNGVELKDMPDEWFFIPSDESMKNSLISGTAVITCLRLINTEEFKAADELMEHILKFDSLAAFHRTLVVCERVYIELITQNRKEVLDTLLDEEQKQSMKQMESILNVLRTKYTYALLQEKDMEKADQIMLKFKKLAETYPYKIDVESEFKLIKRAQQLSISATT